LTPLTFDSLPGEGRADFAAQGDEITRFSKATLKPVNWQSFNNVKILRNNGANGHPKVKIWRLR
jgi:hypothetical protein